MLSVRFSRLPGPISLIASLLFVGTVQAQTSLAMPAMPDKPTLVGATLNGKPFTLASKRGDVVLVTFWATWCPICSDEMPVFRKFYEINKANGFDLVAVSIDDNMRDLTNYANQSNWMTGKAQVFPSLWRNAVGHKDDFGNVSVTPSAFLIDRDGKVIATFKGAIKREQWARIQAAVNTPVKRQ